MASDPNSGINKLLDLLSVRSLLYRWLAVALAWEPKVLALLCLFLLVGIPVEDYFRSFVSALAHELG